MTDQIWMNNARLIAHEAGSSVGSVVVYGGELVGYGFRHTIKDVAGNDYITIHAEQMAISHAGIRAMDATIYTTLEPCTSRYLGNHISLPSPCCELIAKSGIRRTVYLEDETNSDVKGGAYYLSRYGINITQLKELMV